MESSELSHGDHRSNYERAQDLFILEWGRMSNSWGINRTMAQIHALLFVSGRPMAVNEIMDRLQISRGNASMNLRELMDWGIVRKSREPGDRKDMFVSDLEPYQMFLRVIRERKRREIDPTADAIREVLLILSREDTKDEGESLRRRLEGLLEIFGLIDAAYQVAFAKDASFDEIRGLVASREQMPE
ncbi:MAG: GbsR/MarR family transcriptional regulator [Fimbriimonas sp.]